MGIYKIEITSAQMQETRNRHEEFYGYDDAVELMDQAIELWDQARQEASSLIEQEMEYYDGETA